ncbi:MAG: DUF424 family protein [Candidatus Micrarchaeaceae archaeon]
MIYVKKYDTENGSIIALCDEELLGKTLSDGNAKLDLDKYAEFYRGELVDEEKLKGMIDISDIYSANIVGKRAVGIFLEKKIVKEKEVKRIRGVPFAQVYSIRY